MLLTTAIAIFLIAWSSIFLVDYILRTSNYEPYIRLVTRYGIEVSPFQLKFYITSREENALTEPFIKDENDDNVKKNDIRSSFDESRRSKLKNLLIRGWFGCGAIASIVCLIGITSYMSHILLKDVGHWMSTRPKVTAYRGMEYRSMQNMLLMTSPIPTAVQEKQLLEQQENQSHDPVIVASDGDFDMIEEGGTQNGGLVPIIPGFNLPLSHIPIFMLVLIISAVIHELGHAWAATSNGVSVNGFGVFVMGLYPGAFTDIEPVSLKRASSFRRLQIFGAGIWHNLLLSLLAVALFNASPTLMSSFLVEGEGVSIKRIDARSGLSGGSNGLHKGDVVTRIDECYVETVSDWLQCIRTAKNQHNGRCVDKEAVEAATAYNTWTSTDEIHCCDEFNVTNAHFCFEREEKVIEKSSHTQAPQLNALLGFAENVMKAGKEKEKKKELGEEKPSNIETKYSCLNARYVVQQAVCNVTNLCAKEEDEAGKEKVCVYPALFNGTRLVKIGLANRAKPILFVGHLNEMLDMVSISSYSARFSFVDISWLEHFQLAIKYLFTLSLALGLVNAMPCYALDGQFIVSTLLKSTGLSIRRRELIRYLLLNFGTAILILNIVVGFIKTVFL